MKKLTILATSLLALALGLRFLPQPQAFAQAVNHYVAATFHPSATVAGLAVECTTLPSSPSNGGIACDSGDSNRMKVRSNGAWVAHTRGLGFTIGDPGGSALSAASTTTAYLTVPFACTISAYDLAIDAGTITVKFWKVGTGTAIPTSSNSINTSGVSIASGTAIHSATLTDFTSTAVSANDILAMNVTAVATAKYVQGVLQCDQ